jgi:hypothetical protein
MAQKIVMGYDWCEPNFLVCPKVAEPWNTVTSLSFCLPFLTQPRNVDFRWMAFLGLASAWYHATLSDVAQMADEFLIIVCLRRVMINVFSILDTNWSVINDYYLLMSLIFPFYDTRVSQFNVVLAAVYHIVIFYREFRYIRKYHQVAKKHDNLLVVQAFTLLLGTMFWITERISDCSAEDIWQFHSFWHILSMISFYAIFVYVYKVKSDVRWVFKCD